MKLTLGTGKAAITESHEIELAADVREVLVCGPPIDRARYSRSELDQLKAANGWYSFASYRGRRRATSEINEEIDVLSFDLDEGGDLAPFARYSGIVLETATSTPEARRWRVHLDLSDPVPARQYRALLEAFAASYGVPFDRGAADPARLWYRRVIKVARELPGRAGLAWRSLYSLPSAAEVMEAEIAVPELTAARRREIIDQIMVIWPAERAGMESREEWIRAGMALHASTGGDPWGLAVWEQLSKRCPEKYGDGRESCAGAWATFKATGARISLEQLAHKLTPSVEEYPEHTAGDYGAMDQPQYSPLKTEWIWKDHLARGALHLLAGAPGVGKSQAALGFAAAITRGAHWPDGTRAPKGSVVIFTPEDAVRESIVPRFLAAGGDLGALYYCDTREDITPMLKALRPTLLILDPITSGIKDQNDAAKVREQLEPLAKLAQTMDTTILGLTHFAKRSSDIPTIERILGSTSFVAVARIVMAMAEGDHGRVFAVVKSNVGRFGDPRGYTIEGVTIQGDIETSHIIWGAPLAMSVETAMTSAVRADVKQSRAEVRNWLLDALANGRRAANDMYDEGVNGHGFSKRTIERACADLGVVREQSERQWYWRLDVESELEKLI